VEFFKDFRAAAAETQTVPSRRRRCLRQLIEIPAAAADKKYKYLIFQYFEQ
jgi:hypothetical protein